MFVKSKRFLSPFHTFVRAQVYAIRARYCYWECRAIFCTASYSYTSVLWQLRDNEIKSLSIGPCLSLYISFSVYLIFFPTLLTVNVNPLSLCFRNNFAIMCVYLRMCVCVCFRWLFHIRVSSYDASVFFSVFHSTINSLKISQINQLKTIRNWFFLCRLLFLLEIK